MGSVHRSRAPWLPQALKHRQSHCLTTIRHGFGPRGDGSADSLVLAPGAVRDVRLASGAAGTYFYWAALASWRNGTVAGRRKEDSQLGAFSYIAALRGN